MINHTFFLGGERGSKLIFSAGIKKCMTDWLFKLYQTSEFNLKNVKPESLNLMSTEVSGYLKPNVVWWEYSSSLDYVLTTLVPSWSDLK